MQKLPISGLYIEFQTLTMSMAAIREFKNAYYLKKNIVDRFSRLYTS